ncbi:MAG: hypothetical protein V4557_08435 [Bacteroidota bacterium]
MKILLTILAVLVMDIGEEEFSSETKPCVCSCKMKKPEKPVIVAEGSTLLNRLQS